MFKKNTTRIYKSILSSTKYFKRFKNHKYKVYISAQQMYSDNCLTTLWPVYFFLKKEIWLFYDNDNQLNKYDRPLVSQPNSQNDR